MQTDVVVIGAGLAGMVAAWAAQAEGADVLLVDRGPIGIGTNSALANAVFAGPTSGYDPEDYVRDTLRIGKRINHEGLVRVIAREVPAAFDVLRTVGLELAEASDHYVLRPLRQDVIRGLPLVKDLAAGLRGLARVRARPGFYVTEIITDGAAVQGVRGLDQGGEEVSIKAPAVVMAAGGAGAIYLRNDNQRSMFGQGYTLAAGAGLDLWDMEFVQFYPLVMAEPRLPSLMLYPPYPDETRVINASGEDVTESLGIGSFNEAIKTRRDAFSAALFEELRKGPVYMDFRDVPSRLWERYPLTLLRKIKFDFRKRPVAISPGAHFFMGGVRIDEEARTSLPGLFACGELAWGVHGANRRGGNALSECMVFGRIAGRSAARFAATRGAAPLDSRGPLNTLPPDAPAPMTRQRALRQRIREIAWKCAGVVRTEQGLKAGLRELAEVKGELQTVAPQSLPERRLMLDLMSAAFVLRAVLTASLARPETRGAFIRRDYPRTEDTLWQKNSCLAYDREKDRFTLTYHSADNVPQ